MESALRQNFKSYGAWHHRKWVISKGHSSVDHELRLLDKFQKADSRNFHAWNYRRLNYFVLFVVIFGALEMWMILVPFIVFRVVFFPDLLQSQ